jgi:hypothetical protein
MTVAGFERCESDVAEAGLEWDTKLGIILTDKAWLEQYQSSNVVTEAGFVLQSEPRPGLSGIVAAV